jgi:hypothetical protein
LHALAELEDLRRIVVGGTHIAYSFAAQAAEVSVETRTGEVAVRLVITTNDVGKCLNPLGFQGQAEGGVMMSIGGALTKFFIVEDSLIFTDRMALPDSDHSSYPGEREIRCKTPNQHASLQCKIGGRKCLVSQRTGGHQRHLQFGRCAGGLPSDGPGIDLEVDENTKRYYAPIF